MDASRSNGASTTTLPSVSRFEANLSADPAVAQRVQPIRATCSNPPARETCVASCASEISRQRLRQINTTGKSPKVCPAPRAKINRWPRRANQKFNSARLTR
jgi:hypothetical protein